MKLDRLHEYVTAAAATAVGMVVAVLCGNLTGRGQMGTLLLIVMTFGALALTLALKQRIWMLIPIFWSLTGRIRELPVPFAVRDLLIISTFVISLIFIALKIVRGKAAYRLIDLLMFGLLLYVFMGFLRNPVGVDALNSTRVGGRPYFDIVIATLSFWIISRVAINERESRVLPILVMLGSMINGVLSAITFNIPATVPWMTRFYSGVSAETYTSQEINRFTQTMGEAPSRHAYLGTLGINPLAALFAYFPPMQVLNPFRWRLFLPLCLSVLAILGSGFRSMVVTAAVYFCIGSYVRNGWRDIFRVLAVAFPLGVLLIAGQGQFYELPKTMQRTLSFLPGKWDPASVAAARHSTEWRIHMWKIVLTEDKYIQNKWLGDGFGFSKNEHEMIQRTQARGGIGDQEGVMIMGGVHSGPISAIRYVGAIGLLIYTVLVAMLARYAWRLIKRAKGTPFFPMAIFLGAPCIWFPFDFWIIFGAFEVSLPQTIFYLGLLNMLRNSLDRAEEAGKKNVGSLPPRTKSRYKRPLLPEEGALAPRSSGPVWQPRLRA